MAFLCPVRIRRGKIKKSPGVSIDKIESKDTFVGSAGNNRPVSGVSGNISGHNSSLGLGRITGSASIETLVRVGIEKEHGISPDSKMVVLHDFTPCVDDELEVKRGQYVNILYRENDWVYVIGQNSRQEGFIPHSYCAPLSEDLSVKKKMPRCTDLTMPVVYGLDDTPECMILHVKPASPIDHLSDDVSIVPSAGDGQFEDMHKNCSASCITSELDFLPFSKDPSGRYIVLYTFIARDENDVSVERGEFVTVLNREDPEWVWIVRSDGQEGFIPSGFVYPADNILIDKDKGNVSLQTSVSIPDAANSVIQRTFDQQINMNIIATTSTAIDATDDAANSVLSTPQQMPRTSIVGKLTSHIGYTDSGTQQVVNNGSSDDLRYHGTELVMLYDYKAQAPDDLSIRRGDWIYADLNNQTVDGWLWAYSPKTRKYGFIPNAYARPPAMTSL